MSVNRYAYTHRNVVRYGMHMLATYPVSRALAALIPACVLLSIGTSAQAQQPPAAPSHQEHGNLILEGVPPLDATMAARLERYQQSRQGNVSRLAG